MDIVRDVKQTSNRHRHPQSLPSEWERTVDRVVDCVIETLYGPPHALGWTRARRLKEASRIIRRTEDMREEHISAAVRQLRRANEITLAECDRI